MEAKSWQTKIYILLSIKTRIETAAVEVHTAQEDRIYILLSIKTRIETHPNTALNDGNLNLYPTIH